MGYQNVLEGLQGLLRSRNDKGNPAMSFDKATCGAKLACCVLAVFLAAIPAAALAQMAPVASPGQATAPDEAGMPQATAPSVQATAPAAAPNAARSVSGSLKFPSSVAAKYASQKAGAQRRHTCLDQYRVNKASTGNGNLKWVQKGGGYYSACSKRLKSQAGKTA